MKILRFLRFKFLIWIFLFLINSNLNGKSYKRDFFVPEPLYFDLVRNLGSKKGEFEINSLMKLPKQKNPKYAHEVEYTLVNNHAIELELPMSEGKISDIKFAYQYTLPDFNTEVYKHGLQFISEQSISDSSHTISALYLSAFRLNHSFGILVMNGFQRYVGVRHLDSGNFDSSHDASISIWAPEKIRSDRYLGNFNFFYDYSETWIYGIEVNLRTNFRKENEFLILPNVKYHISEKTNLHFGVGLANELEQKQISPISIFRFVLEI